MGACRRRRRQSARSIGAHPDHRLVRRPVRAGELLAGLARVEQRGRRCRRRRRERHDPRERRRAPVPAARLLDAVRDSRRDVGSRGRLGQRAVDIFAVGDDGTIVHWDGTAWSAQASGTDALLGDVWGSGPNDVFAVGLGKIVHYDA